MKHKSTKNALLMSFTSLLLCIAMLLGTTFAWFTDSVTANVNRIVSGNLDIEVSCKDSTGAWTSIQGKDTLFSTDLWEPGHTEYVTLKIENKGTLAFKYQVNVTPVSESGGINMAGESFKLSDYLVFASTEPSATAVTYENRAAARAAAGDVMALNQAGLSKTGEMLAGDDAEYITLVMYMPEEVGNEANYKTGTPPPSIDLGITVLATQLQHENDSFDNTYDDPAFDEADKTVDYDFFPQVDVTGQLEIKAEGEVAKGSTAGGETTVTKNGDDTSTVMLASAARIGENTAAMLTVKVNKGELEENETGSLRLKIVKDDVENANFQSRTDSPVDPDKQDSTTYQVTVECEGVVPVAPATGKAKFKVELFIGKSRTGVEMYHDGVKMTENASEVADTFTYDPVTGYVTMYVNDFSPFTAVYDQFAAMIGNVGYYALTDAFAASKDGDKIVVLKDAKLTAKEDNSWPIKIENKTLTLDTNGKTITNADAKNGVRMIAVWNDAKLTVTGNGKFLAGEGNYTGDNSSFFDVYGELAVNGGYFESANTCIGTSDERATVTVRNAEMHAKQGGACLWACWGGTIDVYGLTFYGDKEDAEGSGCVWAGGYGEGNTGTVNIYGGTFYTAPMDAEFASEVGEVADTNYCLYDYYDATDYGFTAGTIKVYGGTFKDFDPSGTENTPGTSNYLHNYVAYGCAVTKSGENTWTVSAAN